MSVSTAFHDHPSVEITIKYSGKELTDKERQSPMRPLQDIDDLGTELNVPISQKIIEGHSGTLEIKSQDENNIFIIKLPFVERSETGIPMEKGRLYG
jgi:nitrogen-specific signal transduction histidine kinase